MRDQLWIDNEGGKGETAMGAGCKVAVPTHPSLRRREEMNSVKTSGNVRGWSISAKGS